MAQIQNYLIRTKYIIKFSIKVIETVQHVYSILYSHITISLADHDKSLVDSRKNRNSHHSY